MEEIWEVRIHTLDVGQGDSSVLQIRKVKKVVMLSEKSLEDYLQECLQADRRGYRKGERQILLHRNILYFDGEEIGQTEWECNILIDGGEEGQEEKLLCSINQNVKECLDAVVITHADTDHYGGIFSMLAKNNFWHVCKVVYFVCGGMLLKFVEQWEGEMEWPDNWLEQARGTALQVVTHVLCELLDFSGNMEVQNYFIGMFTAGLMYVLDGILEISDDTDEFLEEMRNYFKDSSKNKYAVQFLYRKLMEDGRIRQSVECGQTGNGHEIHTMLPLDLKIFLSKNAGRELFGARAKQYKKEILEGKRLSRIISVKEKSSYLEKYGVGRQIRELAVSDIGMDFLNGASEGLEPDVVPIRLVLAAVDKHAEPDEWGYRIHGDSNRKNCDSIAVLLQAGGFLHYSGGDLPGDGEARIAENCRAGAYPVALSGGFAYYMGFKAGHHGSDTATADEFLDTFSPGYAVISCGDHTQGSGKTFEFPSKNTILRLIRRADCDYVFATAYPNVEEAEAQEINLSGKVIVTGYYSEDAQEARYNRSGDMVCTVQAYGLEGRKEYSVEMEAYVGEGENCIWRTYPLFCQMLQGPQRSRENVGSFVLIPGVLEFDDIRPLGESGFAAEFELYGKRLSARFADLAKWRCYEGTLAVLDGQALGFGELLSWIGGLFPGAELFSGQKEWKLDNLGIDFIYLYWNAWAGRMVTMEWHGRVTVGGFDFLIAFVMPECRMELELRPGQKLTLEDCLEKAGLPAGALGFFGQTGLEKLLLRILPMEKGCDLELRLGMEGELAGSREWEGTDAVKQPYVGEKEDGCWALQTGAGISFNQLELRVGFRKGQGFGAEVKGFLSIGGMLVRFLACYEKGEWILSGEMEGQEGISLDAVAACVAKEAGIADIPPLPADFWLSYAAVEIRTAQKSWKLVCAGRLVVSGLELDMALTVETGEAGGQRGLLAAGTVTLLGVDFSCVFEKIQGQPVTLFYIQKEDGFALDLQELVRLFDKDAILPVDARLVMREVSAFHLPGGGMAFQATLGGELGLSLRKIQTVGEFLPESVDFKLDSVKIGYIRAVQETDVIEQAGHILASFGLSGLPGQVCGGFFLEVCADAGGEKKVYFLGNPPVGEVREEGRTERKTREGQEREIGEDAAQKAGWERQTPESLESPGASVSKSFAVNKKWRPLELHRISLSLEEGRLWVTPEITVAMGCFLVDFTDVSIGASLADRKVLAKVDGMGLSYRQPGLALAASFGKTADEEMEYRYDGLLSVQASKWQLTGMGSYGKRKDGSVSFYLFLEASMRIMLQPSLLLTGVMAGAGIKKELRIPSIDEVGRFPLLTGGSSPLAVLDELHRSWLVPGSGKDWLAVGVRFRIAELIDGQALLMANLGGEPEFALLGLCEWELPKGAGKPYLHMGLQLKADVKPSSGSLCVEVAVGKNSYLLCPDCHITGGAALYAWFAPSAHRGDFVVTVGGYHPAFAAPGHYPKADRVGISWQVSSHVSLKGEAYFALTPSCAMAGGNFCVAYENGNLKAWFQAWANLLVAWKRFYFLAEIGVNLGVSYRLNLLFCHKTLTVSLGGNLRLWGPPTGGKVKVRLWFVSFTISFGEDGEGDGKQGPLSWKEFRELLPHGDVIQIHPSAGLENQSEDGAWLVRGKDFGFEVESFVPASGISIAGGQKGRNGQDGYVQGEFVHIRPMDLTEVDTGMKVWITCKVTESGAEDCFAMAEKRERVAEFLWGRPLYRDGKFVQSTSVPGAGLLDGHLTGAEFTARGVKEGEEIVIGDLDALSVLQKSAKEEKTSLRLVDYRLPVLKAGWYDIVVEQGVSKEGKLHEPFPVKKQSFYVGGCRFSIKRDMVVNTYPPRGSAGDFSNALPHVVLADSTLPWERQYGALEKTPWLALFLLCREEIEPGENGDGTQSMPVDEFCRKKAGIGRAALEREPGVDGDSLCRVLTLPMDIYRAILPAERELCLLSHGRDVELSGRAENFDGGAGRGGFAVVMANRLPESGEYTGYLVSLEGTEGLGQSAEEKVQLLCMDSFSFCSVEREAEDFYHMAQALLENNRGRANLGSDMGDDGDSSGDGYCAIRFHGSDGTEGTRRFRGVLKPVGAADIEDGPVAETAVSMGCLLAMGRRDFVAQMLLYREKMADYVSRMRRMQAFGKAQGTDGLAGNGSIFSAVRGMDGSFVNLLRPVHKGQWADGRHRAGDVALGQDAGMAGSRWQPGKAYVGLWEKPERDEGRQEFVCQCLQLSGSLEAAGAQEARQALDQWLEDLLLLKGVPFGCLLPSERLLPPESVRFFEADMAWLQAMASGAARIGENCRKQSEVTKDLLDGWRRRIGQAQRYGVLIRSHMLRLWRNAAVSVYRESGEEVKPLRMERLAEDILLILCDAPLAEFKIREPSEGIRMQFSEDGTVHCRNPRTMENRGVLGQGEQWRWFRDSEKRILNVAGKDGFADMFEDAYGKEGLSGEALTPAGFALQFLEGRRSVTVKL